MSTIAMTSFATFFFGIYNFPGGRINRIIGAFVVHLDCELLVGAALFTVSLEGRCARESENERRMCARSTLAQLIRGFWLFSAAILYIYAHINTFAQHASLIRIHKLSRHINFTHFRVFMQIDKNSITK